MRSPDGYKTRQRAVIEQSIGDMGDRHFTVDDIVLGIVKNGGAVGRTTVWRSLEKLTDEGKLRKYQQSGESACYQFVPESGECHEHFHLKCEKCGRLIHVECETLSRLAAHIEEEHRFSLNPLKTVLYGVCEKCSAE